MFDPLKYQNLVNHCDAPLFVHPDWLSLVAPDWKGILIDAPGSGWTAALPFVERRKWGLKFICAPLLTPFAGPIIQVLGERSKERRGRIEVKIHQQLIANLPSYDLILLPFSPHHQNWLPYYWAGFGQRTLYTFRVNTERNLDQIFAACNGKKRTHIRRGSAIYDISSEPDIASLYTLVKQSLHRRGVSMPYALELLQRVYYGLHPSGRAFQLSALSQQGDVVASILLVCDSRWMYYLLSGRDQELDQGSAVPFLIWKGIELAKEMGLGFDFEGSIYPGIYELFRDFGGELVGYHQVFRGGNRLLDWGVKGFMQRS